MTQPNPMRITDVHEAVSQLGKSNTGRSAMRALLTLLDGESLDQDNKQAVLTILTAAWGPFSGSARDAMREKLEAQP